MLPEPDPPKLLAFRPVPMALGAVATALLAWLVVALVNGGCSAAEADATGCSRLDGGVPGVIVALAALMGAFDGLVLAGVFERARWQRAVGPRRGGPGPT